MEISTDDILKAIANPVRRQMLVWLKNPEEHFPEQHPGHPVCEGVCVGKIVEKTGLSQSTVSAYMDCLQRAGLVSSCRAGQWTFYRRNDDAVAKFAEILSKEL